MVLPGLCNLKINSSHFQLQLLFKLSVFFFTVHSNRNIMTIYGNITCCSWLTCKQMYGHRYEPNIRQRFSLSLEEKQGNGLEASTRHHIGAFQHNGF